jgi:hypothetical protein
MAVNLTKMWKLASSKKHAFLRQSLPLSIQDRIYAVKPKWRGLVVCGQSSWLEIQRSGFDSRSYQIFWEVVGLEQGLLSLVSTIEELLDRKSSSSGLENREYGCRDTSHWPCGTIYPQKLALTSLTSGSHSVSSVRSRTHATEFSFLEAKVA